MSVTGSESQRVSLDGLRLAYGGLRSALRRLDLLWPVIGTALMVLGFSGLPILEAHGNPAALVRFGNAFAGILHPPAGDPRVAGVGYDGQLYWLQATDPWLLHPSRVATILHLYPSYGLQRMAYPALAWLVAGGQRALIAWGLFIVNVAALLGITFAFAVYARRRGWNPAWALAVGLAPGALVGISRDLSDVLATACLLGGMLAWERQRGWSAGALLALSALSREPMILAVVAVMVDFALRCWSTRTDRRRLCALIRRCWPAIALPIVAYAGWRLYVSTVVHGTPSSGAPHAAYSPLFPPFRVFLSAAQSVISAGSPAHALFVLPYLALTLAGIGLALRLLVARRGHSAALIMAVLYGCMVLSVTFLQDEIALTRYTTPLFYCLLLAGLQYRSRATLTVTACATAMTFLLPLLAY